MLKHTRAFAAVGAVVLAGSSAAYATTTTTATDDVVKACYLNRVGSMRYAVGGSCLLIETPITWNKSGRLDPWAPSDLRERVVRPVRSNPVATSPSWTETRCCRWPCPRAPGWVNASGTVSNADEAAGISCSLHSTQKGTLSSEPTAVLQPDSDLDVMALTGVVTHTTGATVRVVCDRGTQGELFASKWGMTAVQAGSVLTP